MGGTNQGRGILDAGRTNQRRGTQDAGRTTSTGTDQSGEGKLDARLINQGKEPYVEMAWDYQGGKQ
jgi:hypothetical protein